MPIILSIVIRKVNEKGFQVKITSVLAHRAMIDGGMKAKDRRDKTSVDRISAAIILQSYLDRTGK